MSDHPRSRAVASLRDDTVKNIEAAIREGRKAIAEIQVEVRAMEDARAALLAMARQQAPRRKRALHPPSARKIAGPSAIRAVAVMLMGIGRTTQAEITKATGKNSGTITHALRALEDEKMARRTGRRAHGSEEWSWQGPDTIEAVDARLFPVRSATRAVAKPSVPARGRGRKAA